MKSLFMAVVLSVLSFCFQAFAQTAHMTTYLKDSLSNLALQNILKAEKIFCYTVEMPKDDYEGYTLNQMAITGFCGILEENEKNIFIEEFFSKEKSLSTKIADCVVRPRVMLRFFRGIDSTDVLVSSPCPSFTFFYGGTLKSFNAEPSSQSIQDFLSVYEQRHIDFVSPTLLNQLIPIGIAQTDEQRALVAKQNEVQPKRNWVKDEPQETSQSTPTKGWNRINVGKKN